MTALRRWRSALDVAGELATIQTMQQFLVVATDGLQAALEVDAVAFAEWHPAAGVVGTTVIVSATPPPDPEASRQVWAQHHREDRWIRHVDSTGDHGVIRLTDHSSHAELSQSPTYQACYRTSGFTSMAHLPLALESGCSSALGIGRTRRTLDDDDVELFEALRRPLVAAFRRCRPNPPQAAMQPLTVIGTRLPAPQAGAGHGLTPRQVGVLGLVAHGLTNDQIGRRLAISPRTVKKHLEAIFATLDVPNRAAAVTAYRRRQDLAA